MKKIIVKNLIRRVGLTSSVLVTALALPLCGYSQIVQTVNSAGATTEWNDSIWGPGPAAPTSGNDYQTASGLMSSSDTKLGVTVTGRVRAYGAANSASPTFAGDSLELVSDTELLLKDQNETYLVSLILNGGVARWAPNSPGGDATLAGSINVVADSYLGIAQTAASVLTVNSTITGSSLLHLAAGDGSLNTLRFNGDLSGFTGTFDIGGGTSSGGPRPVTVDFDQDYTLSIDLLMGDYSTPDILNLDQDLTFNSLRFNGVYLGAGTYSAAALNALAGDGTQFVDNGGSLTLAVPEPGTMALLATGMMLLFGLRQKR
jgi:hypothetical protein